VYLNDTGMISTQDLRFSYSPEKNFTFPSFHCSAGQALLILGQSGRGKTTFLHLLALLLKPEAGEILIDDENVAPLPASQQAAIRAQKIGIIYQRPHFVGSLSVLDNLLLANYLSDRSLDKAKAIRLADALGFGEHLSKKTNQLSQGEQQRVSIARALMNNPSVLLADEPTSSLDDTNCTKVVELLKQQSEQVGASLVVVTHDQRLKEAFTERVILA
jgi:putative ABC transport system ATP-binding protein